VDHSLLRSWLGLPPGPWPPDHYALLGLAPGPCEAAAVERLVLARMARLRPHQLLHPELVTEGMNRLAQALVCLTDDAARLAYDAELEVARPNPPPPFPQREGGVNSPPPFPASSRDRGAEARSRSERSSQTEARDAGPTGEGLGEGSVYPAYEPIPGFPIPTDDELPPGEVTQVIEVRFEPGLAPPEPLPPAYEVVETGPPEPLPPAYEVVETEIAPLPAGAVVEAELVSPPPEAPWRPATRRQLYARLAAARWLLTAWQQLRPVLGDPREPLDRPARVLALLEAVAAVRPLLDSLPGLAASPGRPGGLVAAILRQPLLLSTLRTLLPDQRRALAIDWRKAEQTLTAEYGRLRELVRSGRPLRRRRSRWRLLRWLVRTPEVALLVLAAAVLIVAFLRARIGP
jgi:hypothetical protein